MADVFVSYARDDRPIAKELVDKLEAAGFDVWWDYHVYVGDDFRSHINDEIRKARAVIVIWSDRATKSRWVPGEADLAFECGTLISTAVPSFDQE